MAKSSKLEDYWQQHGIEGLFKELTHILVQRTPTDPAVAIVQHLQKKYPKSFRTSIDNSNNIGIISKTTANNLQMQLTASPHSEAISDSQGRRRRPSNQSQISGIAAIPTADSAFTDLQRTAMNGTKQQPEVNFRHLMAFNRFGQQAVKLGKNIQSDRDILDEEVIKPTKTGADPTPVNSIPIDPLATDPPPPETREQPSVLQLVKYKQQIRTENDRRAHRQILADLAKRQRDKEGVLQSDLSVTPADMHQQEEDKEQGLGEEPIPTSAIPETSAVQVAQKSLIPQSKEEEDILDDENVFRARKQKPRTRGRYKMNTSRANTPFIRGRDGADFAATMRRGEERSAPMMHFGVCKKCGSMMDAENNPTSGDCQRASAPVTARPLPPSFTAQSPSATGDVPDDWFESASEVNGPRQISPWVLEEGTQPGSLANTLRRNLFQPITDNNRNTAEQRPPASPSNATHDRARANLTSTPRMSETGVFSRSPDPKLRRSLSSRGPASPSPVPKKQQSNTTAQPMSSTLPANTDRRMSGWSVKEYFPDDSDEN